MTRAQPQMTWRCLQVAGTRMQMARTRMQMTFRRFQRASARLQRSERGCSAREHAAVVVYVTARMRNSERS